MKNDNMHFRLCLMLAFQTVAAHSKNSEDLSEKTIEFARRMNEFCNLNTSKAFPCSTITFVDDKGAEPIDEAINRHIEDLRTKENTLLPEDRESLIRLCDRLQQRSARRMQWQFYVTAEEDKIADLVLNLLDAEIEDASAETPQ